MKQAVIDKMANAETRRTEQMEKVSSKAGYHNKHAEDVKVQVVEGAQQWTEAMKQAVIEKLALAEERREAHVNGVVGKVSAKLQLNTEGVQNKQHQDAVAAREKKAEIEVQQRQAELRRAVHKPTKSNKACKAKAAIAMIIGETEAAVKAPASPVHKRLAAPKKWTEAMKQAVIDKMANAETRRTEQMEQVAGKAAYHNKLAAQTKNQNQADGQRWTEAMKQAVIDKMANAEERREAHVNSKVEKVSAKLQKNSEGVQNKQHQEAVEAVEKKTEMEVQARQAELRRAVRLSPKSKKSKSAVAFIVGNVEAESQVASPVQRMLAHHALERAAPSRLDFEQKLDDAEERRLQHLDQVAGKASFHNKHAEGVKVQVQEGAQQWTEAMKQAVIAKLALAEQRRAEHVNGKAEKVSAKLQKGEERVGNLRHREMLERRERAKAIDTRQRETEVRKATLCASPKKGKRAKTGEALMVGYEGAPFAEAPQRVREAAQARPQDAIDIDHKLYSAALRRQQHVEAVADKAGHHNLKAQEAALNVKLERGAGRQAPRLGPQAQDAGRRDPPSGPPEPRRRPAARRHQQPQEDADRRAGVEPNVRQVQVPGDRAADGDQGDHEPPAVQHPADEREEAAQRRLRQLRRLRRAQGPHSGGRRRLHHGRGVPTDQHRPELRQLHGLAEPDGSRRVRG